MPASQALRIVMCIGRAIQIPVALIALALTASLLPTFTSLDDDCTTAIEGIECKRISQTVGGLRYSIATSVLALVDVAVGIAALWLSSLPSWFAVVTVTLDSVTAGFYLGAGSTIASRLNGELCDAGPSDAHFACGRLFADMGFMFVGAVTCYAMVACFWIMKGRRCRSCDTELNGGHALQNPFQDPSGAEAETRNEQQLNKRRSWSQLP